MTRRSQRPQWDDATDPGRAGGRWRLRNWRLRTRLLAALLIPVIAVVVLAGLRIESNLDQANRYAEGAELVRVDSSVAAMVHELQRERDTTVRYAAGGRRGGLDRLREQRERVDAAIGEFGRTLVSAEPDLSAPAVGSFRQMERRLDGLTGVRYAAENSPEPAASVLIAYNELVTGLLDLGDQAAPEAADRELARSRLAAGALARVKDRLSVRRALVAEALETGSFGEDRLRALLAADAELATAHRDFVKFATHEQRKLYDDTVTGYAVDAVNGVVESALRGPDGDEPFTSMGPQEWDRHATQVVDLVKQVEDRLHGQIQQRSDALAADARRNALLDGGVTLGVLLVAALLAVLIARSLLRPLRVLRRSALDVAHYRLPEAVKGILADPDPRPEDAHRRAVEPVPVFSREELGQVARAFDAVHGQAVRLAGEQALLRENVNSMFVNLSRRSQDLVERQLTVLDRMEEHEQDPDVLAGLFELDHLATRMRRNSENLLVLAGQDVGRPLPGAVPAEEIIGAALSEVEHYQRIKVAATPQIAVRGDVVGDLVHVISELFENATDYSPDDAPVSVVSAVTPEGEWRIDITDRGAGMPETEIRRANARLAEPPEVDVEVSRRMGLYVVARLAQRHHIRVRLAAADLLGLTATVVVPAALIRPADPVPQGSPVVLERPAEPAPTSGPQPVVLGPQEPADWPGPEPVSAPEPAPPAEPPEPAPPAERDPAPASADGAPTVVYPPAPAAGTPAPRPREESAPAPQRRAAQWQPPPSWPTEDGDQRPHPLDDDAPTDRLPAYQQLLTRWFDTGEPQGEAVWPTEDGDLPTVNRSPEAVRSRMARLQHGVRRGRHARAR